MRNIGDIISSNRKKLKLSQPMLAELLQQEGINLTVKAISKWETNATEPSVATFLAVCKVLNITNIYEEYFGENPADPLSSLNDEGKEKVLDYIGKNLTTIKEEEGICSYKKFNTEYNDFKILFDKNNTNENKISLINIEEVNHYLNNSSILVIGGNFRTNLSEERKKDIAGEYGLIYILTFDF